MDKISKKLSYLNFAIKDLDLLCKESVSLVKTINREADTYVAVYRCYHAMNWLVKWI